MDNLQIKNYQVLKTGADGGHSYISCEINYNGKLRHLTILFSDKNEEAKLQNQKELNIKGEIQDDGIEYNLIMHNASIENHT